MTDSQHEELIAALREIAAAIRTLGPAGDEVLDVDGAARYLGVHEATVYDFAGRGEIPHRRLGRRLLFLKSALLTWVESGPFSLEAVRDNSPGVGVDGTVYPRPRVPQQATASAPRPAGRPRWKFERDELKKR